MERRTRNGRCAVGADSAAEPAPSRGKENVRPSEKRSTVGKKRSSSSGSARNVRAVPEKNERSHALLVKTLAARRTPFHVHRDDRDAQAASRLAANRLPLQGAGGFPRENRAADCALRSKSIGAPPVEPRIQPAASRRSTSAEDRRRGDEHPVSSRWRGLVGTRQRTAASSRIHPSAGTGGGGSASGNATTPVDWQPPVATVKPKEALRRITAKVADTRCEPKERDSPPVDVLYHAEYNDDLPAVEYEREVRSPRLSTGFLAERFNPEQRRLVVTFMIHLGTHCRYPSFVVYRSVKLFDAAMDRVRVDTVFIQLMALASLWIGLKKDENFHRIPTASTMIALAKELYAGREDLLIACERKILRALDFNVTFADAFALYAHHLINCRRRTSVSDETTTFLYRCGSYVIDLTLLDEQFCRTPVGLIAATVTVLILGLILDAEIGVLEAPRWSFWRRLLLAAVPRLAGRFSEVEMDRTRVAMLRRVLTSGTRHTCFDVVYKKYSRSRYGRISESLLRRARMLRQTETLYDL